MKNCTIPPRSNLLSTISRASGIHAPSDEQQGRQFEFNENDYMFSHLSKRLSHYDKLPEFNHTTKLVEDVRQILSILDRDNPGMWSPGSQHSKHTIPKPHYDDLCRIISYEKHSFCDLTQLLVNINRDNEKNLNVAIINHIIDHPISTIIRQYKHQDASPFRSFLYDKDNVDLDLLYYTVDIFYKARMKPLALGAVLDYFTEVKIPANDANEQQIIHSLFYQNLERRNKRNILQQLQLKLRTMYATMDIHSLTIVSLAYFKTRTVMSDTKSIDLIIDRFIELLPTIDPSEPAFSAILKMLRLSSSDNHGNIERLTNKICQSPYRDFIFYSRYNVVHTLRLLRQFRIEKPDLLEEVGHYTLENLASLRIKDFHTILDCFDRFKFINFEILTRVLEYIANEMDKKEIIEFPLSFSSIIQAMLSLGHKNEQLLQMFNDKEFQKHLFQKLKEERVNR